MELTTDKLAWSPNGAYLAAITGKTVQVWDVKGNRLLFTYQCHTSSVTGIAWSPDSTRIVSVSDDLLCGQGAGVSMGT